MVCADVERELLDVAAVCELFGLAREKLWRFVREGRLPSPDVRLSPSVAYWRRESIDALVGREGGRD
jgi:predicted DNA-binding transcriptional regulator AlpA